MMTKRLFIICFLCIYNYSVFGQEEVNNYKYIIVPQKFEFLKEKDKFQLNSLTKFLFNKYGYTALMQEEDYPQDLRNNPCLALKANLVDVKGGFLITKLRFDLIDCHDKVVVSSKIGDTKEKSYKTAYNIALRGAFETFQNFNYKYQPLEEVSSKTSDAISSNQVQDQAATIKAEEEIERLKQEVEALKEKKEVVSKVENKSTTLEVVDLKAKDTEAKVLDENKKLLYAQPIKNGFQVVDTSPKVIMILMETGKQNVFMVRDKNEIVYLEDGFWYLSKNDGKSVSVEQLNIKF